MLLRIRRLCLSLLILLSIVSMPVEPAQAAPLPTWTLSCVDCPRFFEQMGERSFRIAPDGRRHLVYGGDALYYATSTDGVSWSTEVVDSAPGVGAYAALALDGSNIAISYYDALNGDLKVAQRDTGQGWAITTVDSSGDSGLHTAIAATDGTVHISYYRQDSGDLRYATRVNGIWSSETVDAPGDTGRYTSLVLDGAGAPHISYITFDGTIYEVKYASRSGTTWLFDSAESTPNLLIATSLALSGGEPVIVSYDSSDSALHLFTRSPGGWSNELVDGDGDVDAGSFPVLVIDAAGAIHLAYQRQGKLTYATRNGGPWSFATVDNRLASGAFSSLALTPDGAPEISYAFNSLYVGDLRVAQRGSGNWSSRLVDQRIDVGGYASLALDSEAELHLAYQALYDGKSLRYARTSGAGWLVETVDRRLIGTAGELASLALAPDKSPHISYYGGSFGGVRHIELTQSGWMSTTIQGDSAQNQFVAQTSLAVDRTGVPRLAYAGITAATINYAQRLSNVWSSSSIEMFQGCGLVSLALAGTVPHLAYCHNNRLVYATLNGQSWIKTVLDNGVLDGLSLTINSSGYPAIAYHITGSSVLRYAELRSTGWVSETIESNLSQSPSLSLAIAPTGIPLIAYYDGSGGDLRFAMRENGIWVTQPVAEAGDQGRYASLQVSNQGLVTIAYYDALTHDLKLASTQIPELAQPPTVVPTQGTTTTVPTVPTVPTQGTTTTVPTVPTQGTTTTVPTVPTQGTTTTVPTMPTVPTQGTTVPTVPTQGTTTTSVATPVPAPATWKIYLALIRA